MLGERLQRRSIASVDNTYFRNFSSPFDGGEAVLQARPDASSTLLSNVKDNQIGFGLLLAGPIGDNI
jgi:hypothetical protein